MVSRLSTSQRDRPRFEALSTEDSTLQHRKESVVDIIQRRDSTLGWRGRGSVVGSFLSLAALSNQVISLLYAFTPPSPHPLKSKSGRSHQRPSIEIVSAPCVCHLTRYMCNRHSRIKAGARAGAPTGRCPCLPSLPCLATGTGSALRTRRLSRAT